MEKIIEKLDSYEVMTNLLPGIFFGVALRMFSGLEFPVKNIGEEIAIFYFMGLAINRMGSIVVEPLLIRCKFVKYADYTEYMRAEEKNKKIKILSERCNYYRSLLTSSLLLLGIKAVMWLPSNVRWFCDNWEFCIVLGCTIVFMFGYRKQVGFVYKRVKFINQLESAREQDE